LFKASLVNDIVNVSQRNLLLTANVLHHFVKNESFCRADILVCILLTVNEWLSSHRVNARCVMPVDNYLVNCCGTSSGILLFSRSL